MMNMKNMNKAYFEEPSLQVVAVDANDVITSSGAGWGNVIEIDGLLFDENGNFIGFAG